MKRLVCTFALTALCVATLPFNTTAVTAAPPAPPQAGGRTWTVALGGELDAAAGGAGARAVSIVRDAAPDGTLPARLTLARVPVKGGATADFLLEAFDVFTPDARIVAMTNGVERAVPRPTVKTYRGRSLDGKGDAFFAVDGSTYQALITYDGESSTLQPHADPRVGHVVARWGSAPRPEREYCATDSVPENRAAMERFTEDVARSVDKMGVLLEADLMIDVDDTIFSTVFLGNMARTTNYITTMMATVSSVYQRDLNVRLRMSTMVIWTTPDPFDGISSGAQLDNYRNWLQANRPNVSRDLAHFIGNGNLTNYGGVAYLDVLCSQPFGLGVSNIYSNTLWPAPGYQWDVDVVAHEIGHNFGSPHTHCYSPPIDQCYGEEGPSCYTGPSIPSTGTIMSYCHITTGGKTLNFHERCVTVMRAKSEAAPCFQPVADSTRDTVGVYDPTFGNFFLRNQHQPGGADALFGFGGGGALVPLTGDWNADGVDSAGLYDPATGAFFLRNSLSAGPADVVFTFGPGGAGWVPITGDWNGDGADSIGIYNPANGSFFLKNSLASGAADHAFSFGPAGFTPIAGDWDGDGIDTVGVYDPATSVYFLRNYHLSGGADAVFSFGPGGAGWRPVAGDWNGDNVVSVGLYSPSTGGFFLKNALAPGGADMTFGFGPANLRPLAGNWDAN